MNSLDALLTVAVDRLARLLGPETLLDPWRGMHLDRGDIERLLAHSGHQALGPDTGASRLLAAAMTDIPRVATMVRRLGLSAVDVAILLIAIAPDIDLRYQRIFGYLQDDVERRRPALDLFANLLARDSGERLTVGARLDAAAPLRQYSLVEPNGSEELGSIGRSWRVDDIWRSWLLDQSAPELADATLQLAEDGLTVDALPIDATAGALAKLACSAVTCRGIPLRLLLQGPHGAGKQLVAMALARNLQLRLLILDIRDLDNGLELRDRVQRAGRTASLFGALLYIHGIGAIERRGQHLMRSFVDAAAACPGHLALSCTSPLPSVHGAALPLLHIELSFPDVRQRAALWHAALSALEANVAENDETTVAARFALSAAQIRQAAAEAQLRALTLEAKTVSLVELTQAARN